MYQKEILRLKHGKYKKENKKYVMHTEKSQHMYDQIWEGEKGWNGVCAILIQLLAVGFPKLNTSSTGLENIIKPKLCEHLAQI